MGWFSELFGIDDELRVQIVKTPNQKLAEKRRLEQAGTCPMCGGIGEPRFAIRGYDSYTHYECMDCGCEYRVRNDY